MASQKHLRELLRQDQEPFHLHHYKPKNKPVKPVTKSASSKRGSLYKQACFTSFQDSPDYFNSPLKKKPSATTVLHVPAKTAAGLLEAAAKIQNRSSSKPKNARFAGLFFGSILRKIKDKNATTSKTRELGSSSINGPAFEAQRDPFVVDNSKDKYEMMGYSFSECNYSNISRRISSAGWSESNTPEDDNKSVDMDTISSCTTSRSDYYNHDFVLPDQPHFCLSPLSPFRFALHRSPSVGRRTPDFLSPTTSPGRHRAQEDDDQATENSEKINAQEEDEKDQFSPVSVLDLPFGDDEREDDREEEEEEDEDDYDLECSYALMQKAKFQLLEKLRRFERLAELEPIELEKRMLEGYGDEDDDDDYLDENEEHEEFDEFGMNVDALICEIFSRSGPCNVEKVPEHMKRLVFDLIAEEKKNGMDNRDDAMVKMVCKRLGSWKEVESNTIDMMVELDLKRELDGWKNHEEEVGDRAKEIELAIFGLLMEEVSEELVRH